MFLQQSPWADSDGGERRVESARGNSDSFVSVCQKVITALSSREKGRQVGVCTSMGKYDKDGVVLSVG